MNERIEKLLDRFDWEVVRKVVVALELLQFGVPYACNEMRIHARGLLEQALQESPSLVQSMGFMAEYAEATGLRLSFVVAEVEEDITEDG